MSSCSLCRFPRMSRMLSSKNINMEVRSFFLLKFIFCQANPGTCPVFVSRAAPFSSSSCFLITSSGRSEPCILFKCNRVRDWRKTEKGLNEEPHGGKLKVSILHQFPGCSLKSPSVSLTHSFSIDPFSPSKKHYYEKENKTWLVSWLNKLSMINF